MPRKIEDIVSEIIEIGCWFHIDGENWIRIIPPPGIALTMQLAGRGDELFDYVVRQGLVEELPHERR